MLKEADFHGPYIDPKTGYEYENFGSWFAREAPLVNDHNWNIAHKKRIDAYFGEIFDLACYRTLCAAVASRDP